MAIAKVESARNGKLRGRKRVDKYLRELYLRAPPQKLNSNPPLRENASMTNKIECSAE